MTNADVVAQHFVESFKENLRSVITASAALLDVSEIRSTVNAVLEETLSFLSSSAGNDSAESDE